MSKILTVDDSRAVRLIVSKQAREMGFEVDEAEDGEQALAKMGAESYALIVLDVTMPVLDGPGMLTRMRETGDETPVLMLTSESKRSIVAGLIKLGIADYILKPFKPEDLQGKIRKILKLTETVMTAVSSVPEPMMPVANPAAVTSASSGAGGAAAKAFADLLVIDDMENVSKRLRLLLPERLSLLNALSAQAGLVQCRERVFRVILIDYDLPDVDVGSLVKQLKLFQPHAAILALTLRTTNNLTEEVRSAGFDGHLFKPFDQGGIEEFLLRYFDNQEMVTREDSVLHVAPFKGREQRMPGYFIQVSAVAGKAVEEIAAACYGEVVLDIGQVPAVPEKVTRLVLDLRERCTKMGLELRLVGTAEVAKALRQLSDTADVPFFATVPLALAQGAA